LICAVWFAAGSAMASETIRIVALGDSLTAGYQLPPSAAFPVRLEAALRERGHDVEIVNAGSSGDTASAGRDRLDWSVPEDTPGVIVELGANDALRGVDPATTRAALTDIVETLTSRGTEVLLAGMLAPPNMGDAYREEFDSIFPDLAAEYDLVLYPFFLDGVAMDTSLNLDDGMHPNEVGVDIIVERILPAVEELIERIEANAR
jgi:acyl-CoA thioesterase I